MLVMGDERIWCGEPTSGGRLDPNIHKIYTKLVSVLDQYYPGDLDSLLEVLLLFAAKRKTNSQVVGFAAPVSAEHIHHQAGHI